MRVGSFLAPRVPSRGDRAAETGAVCRSIFCGVDRRCHYLRCRLDLCAAVSIYSRSQICDWLTLARWWRCASSVSIESTELAAAKRDVGPSSHQNSYSHTRTHTDAAVSRRISCYLRRRGCCQQQLGIGARCSSRRRARWSERTASEILRDIQIRQPQRCVSTVCGNLSRGSRAGS